MIKKVASIRNRGLSENEIRPDRLKSGMEKALRQDVKRMRSRLKNFVPVNCPACGLREYINKFKKYGISFTECLNCGTFFTNPRPSPEILEWYYKDSTGYKFWDKYVFPASEKARRKKVVSPRVDLVLEICSKFDINTDSMLEVGAGHGTFCEEVISRKVFKKVVAIEPVTAQAQTCIKRGIDTINKPVEKVRFKKSVRFDVIANFEVMEHLFSPADFIKSCRRFLKKNGVLIFTTPNGQGFDVNLMGKASEVVDHEHLNYFNPRSVEILISRCGMRAIQITTPGRLDAELVRKKIISGDFNLSNSSFIKNILIDNWEKYGESFQEFIANNKLSSHMLVVARNI